MIFYRFKHSRTQDFTMEGVHVTGPGQGVWGTEVPQKLKQNVK